MIRYLPLIVLLFFTLKFLVSFIDKATASLNQKINVSQIENGILSINDLKKDNYDIFIDAVKSYLNILTFININILNKDEENTTDIKATLNKDEFFISALQNDVTDENSTTQDNYKPITLNDLKFFLGKAVFNNCTNCILITNSTFSKECYDFLKDFSCYKNDFKFTLVDGYELTKTIRKYRDNTLKEELIYEN